MNTYLPKLFSNIIKLAVVTPCFPMFEHFPMQKKKTHLFTSAVGMKHLHVSMLVKV